MVLKIDKSVGVLQYDFLDATILAESLSQIIFSGASVELGHVDLSEASWILVTLVALSVTTVSAPTPVCGRMVSIAGSPVLS